MLDFKRLNKEIQESFQILNLVQNLHILAQILNHPTPKESKESSYDWIRGIMKKYNALDSYLFFHQGKYMWYSKKHQKPKKLKYDEKYEILEDGKILYNGVKYPKYRLILPNDNFFTMGYWSHPCVAMHLNHIDSLKLYINSHIDAFIERGGKTSIERKLKIENLDNIEYPKWALDSNFHENHKAALLTKEITRKEKSHYCNFPDFQKAYHLYLTNSPVPENKSASDFKYYMWPK